MSVSDKKQRGLILLCWLVYASAYLGRYSYHANINLIMAEYAVNHASAGLVTTFFFFAYGVGQIVNGILCKYYNKKRVLGGALLVSALLNLARSFFGADFQSMKYLWLANGLVQSVLWPSLVLVLGQNLEEDHLKRAVACDQHNDGCRNSDFLRPERASGAFRQLSVLIFGGRHRLWLRSPPSGCSPTVS